MSKEEKIRLVSTDSDTMAEEVHPVPVEKASGKRGSKAADTAREGGGGPDTAGSGTGSTAGKRKRSCPMYFGVKSYLHHFYDSHSSYKDPSVYEDDDDMYLLHPNPRRRRCPPIWWKVFMWVGVNLLLFGVVGILVGYLVPPKTVIVGENKPAGEWYIDTSAKSYNTTLDMCKLIGLVLFCIGGITLAMSLLFPSFLTHYCDDDAADDDTTKVPLRAPDDVEEGGGRGGGGKPPLSPVEMTIPATSKVKSVQPTSKTSQSVLPPSSGVVYKD
ncbi:uncharacterized protein LOC143295395 isoform X1 [Babylonia areolata]|uniref:uncharacterized protein LOC143295395 isoform X1 n=1 Tax=Babylonia areolata TaxID=304850 RepID=UPI003FD36DC5